MRIAITSILLAIASPAWAVTDATVTRSGDRLTLTWTASGPVDVYESDQPDGLVGTAKLVSRRDADGRYEADKAGTARRYFILRDMRGKLARVAERELPLEKGSNFRDVGGYVGASGKRVRWGRIFRSGAMPMLSEADYARVGQLGIKSIVDLRSLEERSVAPTLLDDKTGALFLSNDYSIKPLMANFSRGNGEHVYRSMETMLIPQFRSVFSRLLASDGAVLYHCSAGQDRTGITTALILSALGVDRKTILADYHLSTALRRLENEMPPVDPKDHPGNPIVQYYAQSKSKPGGAKAEPLYTASGESHLVQFFEYLDNDYGGVEAYLQKHLRIGPMEIARLRHLYLM
jgi:protein-tyrosine phosphatase